MHRTWLLVALGVALAVPDAFVHLGLGESVLSPARVVLMAIIAIEFFATLKRGWVYLPVELLLLLCFLFSGVVAIAVQLADGDVNLGWFFLIGAQVGFNWVACLALVSMIARMRDCYSLLLGFVVGGLLTIAIFYLGLGAPEGRYEGWFSNPNGLALYCAISVGAGVAVLLARREFKFVSRAAAVVCIPLLFVVIDASQSRTGVVVALLAVLLALWTASRLSMRIVGTLAILGAAMMWQYSGGLGALAGTSQTLNRALRIGLADTGGRTQVWAVGWEGVKDTFPAGAGIGQALNIQNFMEWAGGAGLQSEYYDRRAENQGLGQHNTYLTVLLEYGLAGFVFFCSALVALLVNLRRNWRLIARSGLHVFVLPTLAMLAFAAVVSNLLLSPLIWVSFAFLIKLSRLGVPVGSPGTLGGTVTVAPSTRSARLA